MIELDDLDPSISFGYLIKDYDDYQELLQSIYEINDGLAEQMKLITIQSEDVEERILKDLNKKA